jgi:hypothetical protein
MECNKNYNFRKAKNSESQISGGINGAMENWQGRESNSHKQIK